MGINPDYKKEYEFWLENDYFDEDTKDQLLAIKDDETEIKDRFYKVLEFGTGGLRGVMEAGANRMNFYVIRAATQGFAYYISSKGEDFKTRGVVITYDVRHNSRSFAENAVGVFAANGIKTFFFEDVRPTPECSFGVRHFGAAAGVNITASHNPKQYNGYKAYGPGGAPIGLDEADSIMKTINELEDITCVKYMTFEQAKDAGMVTIVGDEVDEAFWSAMEKLSLNRDMLRDKGSELRVVYTPLHGVGNKMVRGIFDRVGISNVVVVKEQEQPDPDFSTLKQPNPENIEAFELALRDAKIMDADILIGNDPDADRCAVVVKASDGHYEMLGGNLTGIVLLQYICTMRQKQNSMPPNPFFVKTIVTTELANILAKSFGLDVKNVHTGFKFIAEQIALWDDTGKQSYVLGFESSFGYLAGTYTRDKDAISASMLICEAALYYKLQGKTLLDLVEEIYKKFGYWDMEGTSYLREGFEGLQKIAFAMDKIRELKSDSFEGYKILAMRDYGNVTRTDFVTGEKTTMDIAKANFVFFELENGESIACRPSGTEPKLRLTCEMCGTSREDVKSRTSALLAKVKAYVEPYL
jgi:phosphoglucomutase